MWLYNCCDRVGRQLADLGQYVNDYPSFYEQYNSDVIRSAKKDEPEDGDPLPQPPKAEHTNLNAKNPRPKDQDDQPAPRDTASAWVDLADGALGKLIEYPAFYQLLDAESEDILKHMIPKVKQILAGIAKARRKAH
jgi:hypothetical protein